MREFVARSSLRVHQAASGEKWRDYRGVFGTGKQLIQARRFPNTDTFKDFLDEAQKVAVHENEGREPEDLYEVQILDSRGVRLTAGENSHEELAVELSKRTSRKSFAIVIAPPSSSYDRPPYRIDFGRDHEGALSVSICSQNGQDGMYVYELTEALMEHTEPFTRGDVGRGVQFLEPLDIAKDQADRQARRLSKRSMLFGGGAGLATGIVAQVVGALLR